MQNVFADRRLYIYTLAFAIFADLELTYIGINNFRLDEGNVIGLVILQHYGWDGLILTYIVMMTLFMICLKLVDIKKQIWARYVLGILCAYHLYVPIQNAITIVSM